MLRSGYLYLWPDTAQESVGKASLKVKASVGLQPYKTVHEGTSSPSAWPNHAQRPFSDGTETLFYAVSSTSGRVVRYQVHVPST